MMNIPGELIIAIDKDIRFGNKKFPLFIGCKDIHGDIHSIKKLIFEETIDHGAMYEIMFIHENNAQDLINDLYRTGLRPSDEIKKDDLIQTLKQEVEKRDKWLAEYHEDDNGYTQYLKQQIAKKDEIITSLMNQFVFKDDPKVNRKISI